MTKFEIHELRQVLDKLNEVILLMHLYGGKDDDYELEHLIYVRKKLDDEYVGKLMLKLVGEQHNGQP